MTAQEAVARLLDHADLLVVTTSFLLAPVSDAVLDALATVGTETEDAEPEPIEDDGDEGDCAVAV